MVYKSHGGRVIIQPGSAALINFVTAAIYIYIA
jgi:hypothetical protein